MATTKKTAKKSTKKVTKAPARAKKTIKKAAKPVAKKTVKKGAAKKAKGASKKASRKAPAAASSVGTVAHTEFVSSDPVATKNWAKKALGWSFPPAMKMPDGSEYHMFQSAKEEGGGIRGAMGPETPGTIVYVEVANIKRGYDKALKNGAKSMLPPMVIPGGMGSMAVVAAPGGVAVGLWSQK